MSNVPIQSRLAICFTKIIQRNYKLLAEAFQTINQSNPELQGPSDRGPRRLRPAVSQNFRTEDLSVSTKKSSRTLE